MFIVTSPWSLPICDCALVCLAVHDLDFQKGTKQLLCRMGLNLHLSDFPPQD